MSPEPQASPDDLAARMRGQFEQLCRDVAAAVNAAPAGRVITDSEEQVRDLLARLMHPRRAHEAGARAENRSVWSGSGSCWTAASPAACGKTQRNQSQRRTAASASENVTTALPGHWTDTRRSRSGRATNSSATTEYRPNRQGAARSTVRRHQPRVVSSPR